MPILYSRHSTNADMLAALIYVHRYTPVCSVRVEFLMLSTDFATPHTAAPSPSSPAVPDWNALLITCSVDPASKKAAPPALAAALLLKVTASAVTVHPLVMYRAPPYSAAELPIVPASRRGMHRYQEFNNEDVGVGILCMCVRVFASVYGMLRTCLKPDAIEFLI